MFVKAIRALFLLGTFVIAVFLAFTYFGSRSTVRDHITVYYTKLDGQTLGSYAVTLGPAHDRRSVAFYAATQALAGPTPGVPAVRFPPGTFVRDVALSGSTVTVDISGNVKNVSGSFGESGEFKSLVWTMTALPGISAVRIKVDGAPLAALPGGHLELDEPLTRSSW